MKTFLPSLFVAAALAGAAAPCFAVVTLFDNTVGWGYDNGGGGIAPYTTPFAGGALAIGQSFVAPEGTIAINQASLWLRSSMLTDLNLSVYLAEWDTAASAIVGDLHEQTNFQLIPDRTTFPPSKRSFTEARFSVDSLPIVEGTSYILFMTADTFGATIAPTVGFGQRPLNSFPTWDAWLLSGPSGQAAWSDAGGDLAFTMWFEPREQPPMSPVPEPSTYGAIAAVVLMGLISFRIRRVKQVVR